MPKTWCCPFFSWEEKLKVYCSCARLTFRNIGERERYIDTSLPAWGAWIEILCLRHQLRHHTCRSPHGVRKKHGE